MVVWDQTDSVHGSAPRRSDAEKRLVLRAVSLVKRLASSTNEWQRTQMEEGFTVNQALVLHHLVKHGDATPSELAEWMHVSRGSMTPTIKRLEDLGLLTRHIDGQDGRKQRLTATQEAHEVVSDVEKKVLQPLLGTFAHWSAKELERFCNDLSRVLESPVFGGEP